MKNKYSDSFVKIYKSLFAVAVMLFSAITIFAGDVDVTVKDCNGNALSGAEYWLYNGNYYDATHVTPGTTTTVTNGNTYTVYAMYNNTVSQPVTFTAHSGTNSFNFTTTNVDITWGGSHLNYGGVNGLTSFTKTNGVWDDIELFPYIHNSIFGTAGPIPVQFNARVAYNMPQFSLPIVVSGCSVTYSPNIIRVLDHNGNPIAGAYARGGYGSTYGTWHVSGASDANGYLIDNRPYSSNGYSYEVKVNNTTAVIGPLSTGYYEFQTQEITMRLEKCDGTPLAGGHVRWGHGTSYGSYHFAGGNTTANGETTLEFFPGTYSFEMGINWTTDTKISYNFPADGATVSFKTTSVTLNYPNSISFGGATGDSHWFTKPTMELFAGTYKFNFKPSNRIDITVGSCNNPINYTAVFLNLKDHNGSPMANGYARGQIGSGYWFHVGGTNNPTDANGNIFYLGNGTGNMTFEMRYNGTKQTITQNVNTNPIFNFQTAQLKARMETCSGDPVDGGYVRFKNGQYKYWLNSGVNANSNTGNLAAGEVAGEVFPGTYDVDMQFRYGENTQSVVVSATGGMTTFKTTNVTATHTGTVSYKSNPGTNSAWYTGPSMEFLPGDYTFMFTNAGSVDVTVGACSNPIFVTPSMVRLIDSDGNGLANGLVKYYKNGWKYLGTTDSNGNVSLAGKNLSGNVTFRMYWKGAAINKAQNLTNDGVVVFQTENVVAELKNSDNTASYAAVFKYYASGWKYLGTSTASTPASIELLPKTYTFRVYYAGAAINKSQNVSVNSDVVFNTAPVTATLSNSDNTADLAAVFKYYASGWKYFGTSTATTPAAKELLPKTYTFRVYYAGAAINKSQNVMADNSVEFATVNVEATLADCEGNELPAIFKYYASGWKYLGTSSSTASASKELLPKTYTFRTYFGGTAKNISQNVTNNQDVAFGATNVTINFPGMVKYYASGWKVFKNAGSASGTKAMLPKTYTFRFYDANNHGTNQQITVGGCETDADFTAANLRLVDSDGHGLIGGTVKWWDGAWHNAAGSTNNAGYLFLMTPTVHTSLQMWYRGQPVQYNNTNTMASPITWQTINVTGELVSSTGGALTSNLKFFALTWQNLDVANPTGSTFEGELLPGTYSFDFFYDGMHTGNILQNISTNSHVTSSTVLAEFCATTTSFYAGYWHNNVGSSYEMIPGNYWFTFDGAPQYQVQIVNSGFYGCNNTAAKRDATDNDIATTEVKLGVYPNPFTDMATFSFELEETSVVKIVIYDLSGKIIKTVANGEYSQGTNQVQWNGTNNADAPAAAGVYFYRIEAGNSVTTNRIILTR